MPVKCSSCSHSRRLEIDAALMRRESDSAVATEYGLTHSSVRRHRLNHLAAKLARLEQAEMKAVTSHNTLTVIGLATDVYDKALRLAVRAEAFFDRVEAADAVSSRTVQAGAAALRELRASIALLADLVIDQPAPSEEDRRNDELDARITQALSELTMPALPAPTQVDPDGDVAEAELVQTP